MKGVISFRVDQERMQALEKIHQATKIPFTELMKQGVDRIIETYYFYIPDAEFRKQLKVVMHDSNDYLRKLANE